jgi:hypothetical protein
VWLIAHTEVAARDSIGFIRYALELESRPWKDVLPNNLQHPGYPLVLMAVSWPVRCFFGGIDSFTMQLSAQLASSLAGVLLVVPMYYLGREFFDRSAGFWGAILYQCLPITSRILSDGLSEATFLLLSTTALLFAIQAVRNGSLLRFALCGFASGLAYLTRPEGAVLVAATSLVLVAMQFHPCWRRPWRRAALGGVCLVATASAVGGPYPYMTGQFTLKPSALWILGTAENQRPSERADVTDAGPQTTSHPLTASILAVYAPTELKDRRLWALKAIGTEIVKGYHYFIGLPVLLGLWWYRDRLRVIPGAWVMLVLCLLHAFILYRLAVRVGYLSERHVQLLVLCGIFTGAATVSTVGCWLWAVASRISGRMREDGGGKLWPGVVLLGSLACLGLPELLSPLHGNRVGHREAGLWLAQNTQLADEIIDPYCWAHYYAGRVFWEGKTPPSPPGYRPTRYVVLETEKNEHQRLPMIEQAKTIARQGKPVYHWPVESLDTEAKILVFAVSPP